MKNNAYFVPLLAIGLILLSSSGCTKKDQNKALLEATIGVAIGPSHGYDIETKLIEAGIGAGAEHMLGLEAPDNGTDNAYSQSSAGDTVNVWITMSNGSRMKITLKCNPDGSYAGPKGERYATMPTKEKLQKVYGI